MKKLVFMTMGLVALIVASCGYKSEIKPLTDQLVTFTVKNDEGKILTGVQNELTDKTIVMPNQYTEISADENTISCADANHQVTAFTINGEHIGIFDMFTHWTEDGDYYLGTNYNNYCYYFPQQKMLIRASASYNTPQYLFIKSEDGWEYRDHYGAIKGKMPNACALIKRKDKKQQDELLFVMKDEKRGGYFVYRLLEDKALAKLSATAWTSKQKILQQVQVAGDITIYEANKPLGF